MLGQKLLALAATQMEADAIASAGSTDIDFQIIGPGVRRMPDLNGTKPAAILLAGIAGGLDPALRCGDVIIDEKSDFPCSMAFRRGRIYTADRIISTPQQKRDIFEQTGALVVEMENAIVRQRAQELGIPFFGLRVVGDCARETLDPNILALIDENGRAKLGAVAAAIFRRPMRLRELLHLRSTTRLALKSLTHAFECAIE